MNTELMPICQNPRYYIRVLIHLASQDEKRRFLIVPGEAIQDLARQFCRAVIKGNGDFLILPPHGPDQREMMRNTCT